MATVNPQSPPKYKEELIRKNEYWSNIISAWHTSSKPLRDFCINQGIEKTQFYYWHKKLSKKINANRQPASNFIELPKLNEVINDSNILRSPKASSILSINILLPNSITITVTVPTIELGNVISQVGGL